jgi:hypothetical protein
MKSLKQHAFLNRDQALEYKLTTKDQSWAVEDVIQDEFDEPVVSLEPSVKGESA